jgi:hypothetical protein
LLGGDTLQEIAQAFQPGKLDMLYGACRNAELVARIAAGAVVVVSNERL